MPGLAAALAGLQAELPTVTKDKTAKVTSQRTGKTHSYTYANLASVTEAVMPLLSRHGLAFLAKPTLLPEGTFVLSYALLHGPTGEAERGLYPLPMTDSPQAMGSAITYARRYCLCAVTGVASDDDDDGQAAERARADGLPTNADGSLSRSRTTDEQKAAAGVMTSAQQAEHTALQPKRERGRVTRLPTTPADDPWAAPPPVEGQEDQPGTVSPQQQRAIHAACTGMDRDKRLATIGDIVGRQVTSSNELSYTEAARVLGKLSGVRA